jgi:hypothetical protein
VSSERRRSQYVLMCAPIFRKAFKVEEYCEIDNLM